MVGFGAILLALSVVIIVALRSAQAAFLKAKEITVFIHDDARSDNPNLADQVIKLFREAEWKVQQANTNLPQHAKGVWIHGASTADRLVAIWALHTLSIKAQIDDSEDGAPLQVIVGAQQSIKASTAAARGPDGVLSQKPNTVTAVNLSWGKHAEGLVIRGTSRSPEILEAVTCTLIDIERWSPDYGRYVKTPELHPSGAFVPMILTGRANLGLDDTADFGALHRSAYGLYFAGENVEKRVIRKAGTWRVLCRISVKGATAIDQELRFKWDGGSTSLAVGLEANEI
jgi:hypothetical protein